jgi:hypothetical protein
MEVAKSIRAARHWPDAEGNRGTARVELGTLTADPGTLRAGIADIEAAWDYDRETGETGYDDYYRKRIEAARKVLERLDGLQK